MKILAELQAANLPRMTLDDVPIERFGEPETVKANEAVLVQYLSQFARFGEERACPLCEHKLVVEWGWIHGEAHCVNCGYPLTSSHP